MRRWLVPLVAAVVCGCGPGAATSTAAGSTAGSTSASTGSTGSSSASSASTGSTGSSTASTGSTASSTGTTGSTGTSGSTGAIALPPAEPVGVNIPDLLWAYLGTSPDGIAGAQAAMDTARARGITFARFIATPYGAHGMTTGKGWLANPMAFWAAFDALMADAHARGLHLVPSLLWNDVLFPDVNGEHVGMLLTPGSATRAMAEQYITAVVNRYKADPTVLFWEMGNELNLVADIDISGQSGGPSGTRTAADDIYTCNACRGVSTAQQDLIGFTASMAALFHQLDPTRKFSTGFAYPRPAAYHLAYSPGPSYDWTADTLAQYQQVLTWLSPAGVDLVSVHHYPGPDVERFGDADPAGLALLATTQSLVKAMGKALYVGEYGQAGGGTSDCAATGFHDDCTTETESDPGRLDTVRLLDGLVADGIGWSSLWAWRFDQFCPGVPTCASVSDADPIADDLQAHARAATACTGAADGTVCPIGACAGGTCQPVTGTHFDFSPSGSIAAWTTWTNCTACTPATLSLASGFARLASNDLACTGTCQYPGAYALSPSVSAQGPHALVTFTGHATGSALVRIIASDVSGAQVATNTASVPLTTDASSAVRLTLPPGTDHLAVRLELHQQSAALDLRTLNVDFD